MSLESAPTPADSTPTLLVLASGSPRRQQLLAALGYAFRTIEPKGVVESHDRHETPAEIATANARDKAHAVTRLVDVEGSSSRVAVLAADTIVVCQGRVFGKPKSNAEAHEMLEQLSGRDVDVITGVCVRARRDDYDPRWQESTGAATTRLRFRELPSAEIEAYVASGEPLGKAGAFAWQETGHRFGSVVDGPESNVIGLPVALVHRLLAAVDCAREPAPADTPHASLVAKELEIDAA